MGIGKQVVLNKMNADPLRYLLSNLENGMERGPRNIIYLSEEAEALIRRAFIKSDVSKSSYNKIRQIGATTRVPINSMIEVDSLVTEVSSMVSEFGTAVSEVGSAASELNSTTSELRSAASELNSATSEVKSAASELNSATSEVRSVATAVNSMAAAVGSVITEDDVNTSWKESTPLIKRPVAFQPGIPSQIDNPEISKLETTTSEYKPDIVPTIITSKDSNPLAFSEEVLPSSITNDDRFVDELIKQIDFLKSEMVTKDNQLKTKDEQLKAKDTQIAAKDEQIKEFQRYVNVMIENTRYPQITVTSNKEKIPQTNKTLEIKKILNAEKKPDTPKKRSIFDTPLQKTTQQKAKPATISSIVEQQPEHVNDILPQPEANTEKLIETTAIDKVLNSTINESVPFSTPFTPSVSDPIVPKTTNLDVAINKPLTIKRSVFDMPLREMEYVEPELGSKLSNLYDINSVKPTFSGSNFDGNANYQNNSHFVSQGLNMEEHFEEVPKDEYYDDFNDKPKYYEDQPKGFFSKFLKKD